MLFNEFPYTLRLWNPLMKSRPPAKTPDCRRPVIDYIVHYFGFKGSSELQIVPSFVKLSPI